MLSGLLFRVILPYPERMAKQSKTVYTVTDDLTGDDISDDFTEVHFAHNGQEWVLDLSRKNADAFAALLEPYKKGGTKVPGPGAARKSKSASRPGIREWAEKEGLLKAGSRGRIAKNIEEAYDAAH